MRDRWSDELLTEAPGPDEAFRSSLRERVLDAWDQGGAPPGAPAGRRSRRWAVVTAAAVVAAAGIVGLIVVRTTDSNGTPGAGGQATASMTAQDVVGTWVVTDSGGQPRSSPLPTYDFTLGTDAETGVVTGFNGCGGVAGTWGLDDGQLHVSIDTGGGGQPCPYRGETTPLALPDDASMAALDGELVMRLGDDGDTIAHRVDGLSPPSSLAGSSWLFPVDGPDLTVAFETDALIVSVDTTTCTTAAYRFDGTTLQVSSPSAGTTTGPCQGAVPTPIAGTPATVVQYLDNNSRSLLLITPSAGTWRVYPATSVATTAASATQPTSAAPTATPAPPTMTMTTVADPVTAADVSGIVWASTDDPPPSRHGAWAQFPITWFLLLPDGSIRGADGCRMFASDPGTWRIEAGTLTTGPIPFSEDTCGGAVHFSPFDDGPITLEPTVDGRLALSTAHTTIQFEPLDETNWVSKSAVIGRWTDGGPNTFEFRSDGVLRFTADTTCDGNYTLTDGRLDVSFGECTGNFTILSSPIFRQATGHLSRWTGRLLISGDAGVFALVPAP